MLYRVTSGIDCVACRGPPWVVAPAADLVAAHALPRGRTQWAAGNVTFPDSLTKICTWATICVLPLTLVGLQDDCAITPVISESSANFIEGLVKDAEQQGAKLLTPYKREGNLIWPVLIDHVTQVSRLRFHASGVHPGTPCHRCQHPWRMVCPGPARTPALCEVGEISVCTIPPGPQPSVLRRRFGTQKQEYIFCLSL